MLELPDLNKADLDKIMTEAKKQLKNMHPQWTDHLPHDPGITILELLAYLKRKQHLKLNTIGRENKLKYLELLNIKLKPADSAYTEVIFTPRDEKIHLPAGTKLRAKDLVFETAERAVVSTNRATAALLKKEDGDESILLENEGTRRRDFSPFGKFPQKGNQFHLFFKEPFLTGEDSKFKISIFQEYPVTRNAVAQVDTFNPLVELQWEYYGEHNGETGWHLLEVREDTTHNFLFSGFLTFRIQGKHLSAFNLDNSGITGYALRCTLQNGEYDVAPRIKGILLNCIPVWQKESLSQSYIFNYQEAKKDWLILDSYLAYFGHIKAFVKEKGYWVEMEEGSDFRVERDWRRKICRVQILKAIDEDEDEDEDMNIKESPVLKFVAREKNFVGHAVIGSSTGFINQSFELELQNIIHTDFKIMVGKNLPGRGPVWSDWKQVGTRSSVDGEEKCFELDAPTGRVFFGDNRRGAVPPEGKDNLVITDCVITKATNGNIQRGNINSFLEQGSNFGDLDIHQSISATGGQEAEDLSRAEGRMLGELKTGKRAVSADDFSRLAYSVPGLMINHVKVLPLYKPGLEGYPDNKEDNCVTLVIEPYNTAGLGKLSEGYKKNIKEYLEKLRLITTRIYIIEPAYAGIEIYGDIVIKSDFNNARKIIEGAIYNYIDSSQQKQQWQGHLSHGDIYGVVDLLECVSYIRYLAMEPFGYRVSKNNKGDITIPADSKFYLKSCDLTLLNSEHF